MAEPLTHSSRLAPLRRAEIVRFSVILSAPRIWFIMSRTKVYLPARLGVMKVLIYGLTRVSRPTSPKLKSARVLSLGVRYLVQSLSYKLYLSGSKLWDLTKAISQRALAVL